MKYEVIPQNETVLVKITEDGVTEQYSMMDVPEQECNLVLKSKKDVLGEINLEQMLSHLDNCVDLLQITFNAVDGFGVQAKVQELSNGFMEAMNRSNVAALDFKLATESILATYINAYQLLFDGELETALTFLTDTKSTASKMVKKAEELVNTFDKLAVYCNMVLKEVLEERAVDEEKRKETKALVNELEGSIKAMEEIKNSLHEEIEQANEEYKKLQQREMQQEKRAYNMQLASMIIGAVSSVFGGKVENAEEARAERAKVDAQEVSGEETTEIKTKRKYSENIGKQEQKETEKKKIDERVVSIDNVLDEQLYVGGFNHDKADATDLDAQKTAEELKAEKQEKINEKAGIESELNHLKGEEKILSDTLSGLGVAMDKLSKDTRDTARDIQKRAESLVERMDVIQKKTRELREKERENLRSLAESTARMQNMVMDENALESAIQCLVIATGCLRKVLAYLHEIKLFWANIETFCDNLAENDTIERLISTQENKSSEQKAAYFKTLLFVKNYIGILAKWQALYVIFTEYLSALAKVSARMTKTMEQSLSADRKQQWILATQLSGNLKNKLEEEILEVV